MKAAAMTRGREPVWLTDGPEDGRQPIGCQEIREHRGGLPSLEHSWVLNENISQRRGQYTVSPRLPPPPPGARAPGDATRSPPPPGAVPRPKLRPCSPPLS